MMIVDWFECKTKKIKYFPLSSKTKTMEYVKVQDALIHLYKQNILPDWVFEPFKYFRMSMMKKDSASSTMVLKCQPKNKSFIPNLFVLKISLDKLGLGNKIEAEILVQVFNHMYVHRVCPHVIFTYDVQKVTWADLFKDEPLAKPFVSNYFRAFEQQQNPFQDTDTVRCVMMQRGSLPLWDFLNRTLRSTTRAMQQDIHGMLVQIYYTLACFNKLRVQHNDMHLGNILINILDEPEVFTYRYYSQRDKTYRSFSIKTRWVPMIFDMNLGTAYATKHVPRHFLLDAGGCVQDGACNREDTERDLVGIQLSLLHYIEQLSVKNEMVHFIISVVESHIGGPKSWDEYKKYIGEKPHYGLFQLRKVPALRTMLARMHSALTCLDEEVDRLQLNPESVEPSLTVWSMPRHVKRIKMVHPTYQLLGWTETEIRDLARAAVLPTMVKPKTTAMELALPEIEGMFHKMFDPKHHIEKRIDFVLQAWKDELIQLQYCWPLHFMHTLYQVSTQLSLHLDWTYFELALVCFALSCPMYYGLSKMERKQFYRCFTKAREDKKQEEDYMFVIECFVFFVFERRGEGTFPIKIPQLYMQVEP